MKQKTVSGRDLRRGSPEENLVPGEVLLVKKRGGKLFELKRVDKGRKSMTGELEKLFVDMPPEGERKQVDLSSIIIEDRE